MAVGEERKIWAISEWSWTGWTALDNYYGLEHSFQYSSNINCDDEMHWIKLSNRVWKISNSYKKCQLVSLGEHGVMALPIDGITTGTSSYLKRIQYNWYNNWTEHDNHAGEALAINSKAVSWTVFQDRFWFGSNDTSEHVWKILNVPLAVSWSGHGYDLQEEYTPYDHFDYDDDSIKDPSTITEIPMESWITAILNYNNTRLIVAAWPSIWVYYPELDITNRNSPYWDPSAPAEDKWKTWWKKVLNYENWVTIVGLTCTFEYLKVRAVDEWWNTQVYFYQGNNNLRDTFVYNLVDLTGVRVLHVYSVNGTDYYTSSIWNYSTDALIDFNKLIWVTPIKLFQQRWWLDQLDINFKAPYFVWPTSVWTGYSNGHFYIADAYWIFSFQQKRSTRYTPWVDPGYMKWKLYDQPTQVYWVCENQWFLYVSTSDWCRAVRLYDSWVDGYQQEQWVLISREYEGEFGGTITKMLKEIRLNYEMNPWTLQNGTIDVYVSPNNLWKSTSVFTEANNWYHVMSLGQTNAKTRTEKSNLLNDLGSNNTSSFGFDRQTLTYAIVIKRWGEIKATPIVRQIDIIYQTKDKVNNVYDIK